MGRTQVTLVGEQFHINGQPTYPGRTWEGHRIEGLLLNARTVQAIFDDLNPATRGRWAYPDTGRWDPERNTTEFLAALPEWREHGLLAVTVNLQGGSPEGYSLEQPWENTAFAPDGSLRNDYFARLERVLDRTDELGMEVILGLFYFGQDGRLADEAAVLRAVDGTVDWLLDRQYGHVLVEVANECDINRYTHEILWPHRVHTLLARVKERTRDGWRLLVSTSYRGGSIPWGNVVREADFLLLHGNRVECPERIGEMVHLTRHVPGYTPKPILFNEDDHFDFDQPRRNLRTAIEHYCSWGYFDPYADGYQSPPVTWGLNTPRKRAFFAKVREITGGAA